MIIFRKTKYIICIWHIGSVWSCGTCVSASVCPGWPLMGFVPCRQSENRLKPNTENVCTFAMHTNICRSKPGKASETLSNANEKSMLWVDCVGLGLYKHTNLLTLAAYAQQSCDVLKYEDLFVQVLPHVWCCCRICFCIYLQ